MLKAPAQYNRHLMVNCGRHRIKASASACYQATLGCVATLSLACCFVAAKEHPILISTNSNVTVCLELCNHSRVFFN